jgi:hypothetical protein
VGGGEYDQGEVLASVTATVIGLGFFFALDALD